jgi:hypothetical protein
MVLRSNRLVLGSAETLLAWFYLTGYLLVYSAAVTRCQELFRRRAREFASGSSPRGTRTGEDVSRQQHISNANSQH